MSNRQISAAQKQFVAECAGHCCEYCFCQLRFSPDPFSVEHIIPVARGGNREHFSWSSDFLHIVGLTSIGRATVEKLKLNRSGVINLRQVLRALSQHPPTSTSE